MYRFVKRFFDIFSCFIALIVLSPLLIFTGIGIKLSSRGSVFFKIDRIGKDRKPFTIYKFRSMHIKEENSVESNVLVNQDRVFPFGKFIRKSKIDELPQLLNVIRGDMSIVGPRPYGKKFSGSNYCGKYEMILSVRPGLACLDSLFDYAHGELFTSDEEEYSKNIMPVRTELAKIYVERKSIWLDVRCIVRTIGLIFAITLLKVKNIPYTQLEREAQQRAFPG